MAARASCPIRCAEGRQVTFDARQYLDNYSDLQGAFQDDLNNAAFHFITSGATENRSDIDPLDYVASHADLIQAFGDFGNAPTAATQDLQHHVSAGRARDAQSPSTPGNISVEQTAGSMPTTPVGQYTTWWLDVPEEPEDSAEVVLLRYGGDRPPMGEEA